MPEFDVGKITLQPYDEMPFTFLFPIASSELKNDGSLPYGTTINDVSVTVWDEDLENVTTDFVDSVPSLDGNKVTVILKYPGDDMDGRYKLSFYLTLSNGTREFDFRNIYVKNI